MAGGLPGRPRPRSWLLEYRRAIRAGEIVAGQELIQTLDNLVADLENPDYVYDTRDADLRIEFIERFCRHTKSPFHGKPFKLELWEKAIIEAFYSFKWKATGFRRFKKCILLIARKNGKALALDTPINTPAGWRTMGDIENGDLVFGASGEPVRVIATSEIFADHECYNVTFEDGERIVADAGHIWTVMTRGSRRAFNWKAACDRAKRRPDYHSADGYFDITTEQMALDVLRPRADGKGVDYKYRVQMQGPVAYPEANLSLDPYVMGVWLGDGYTASNRIACGSQDIEEMLANLRACGIEASANPRRSGYCVKIGTSRGKVHRNEVRDALRSYGVIGAKHIPEEYLRASVSQRFALLQGLMDTDGTVSRAGQCEFTQKSKAVVDGISELLSSLGIKHSVSEKRASISGKDCGTVYRVTFFVPASVKVFRLERKQARLKPELAARMRNKTIVGIERVASVPTKCITVESPDGLYLAGQKMTVTHNSTLCAALALTEFMVGMGGVDIVCSSNDDAQADIIFQEVDNMREQLDPKGRRTHKNLRGIYHLRRKSTIKKLSDRTRNKEGRNIDAAYIDEVHEMETNTIGKSVEQSQSTKDEPILWQITTEGFVNDGYLDHELKYARSVLAGDIEDPTLLVWLYTQDSENEIWQDESSWAKSNPSIGVVKKVGYLRDQIRKAQHDKAERVFTLAKDFNIKQNNASAWLTESEYQNPTPCRVEDFRGAMAIGGVDLSETTDLTCAKALIMRPKDNRKYFLTKYFIPEAKVEAGEIQDRKNYLEWAKQGLITITPGNENDFSLITKWYVDLYKTWGIRFFKVGYDNALAKFWVDEMEGLGFDMERIRMDKSILSDPMKLLEADLRSQLVVYDNNPIDRWCLGNTAIVVDNLGRIMPVKVNDQKNRRIDGAVTKIIAYATYMRYRTDYLNIVR